MQGHNTLLDEGILLFHCLSKQPVHLPHAVLDHSLDQGPRLHADLQQAGNNEVEAVLVELVGDHEQVEDAYQAEELVLSLDAPLELADAILDHVGVDLALTYGPELVLEVVLG